MDRFCHIGKGNVVNSSEVECILYPGTIDAKRRVREAEAQNLLIRANRGRPIRSLILMKSGRLILCLLSYETLMNRLMGITPEKKEEDEDVEEEEEE